MNIVKFSDVQDKIIIIRDENVILDYEVAELYGVQTKGLSKNKCCICE